MFLKDLLLQVLFSYKTVRFRKIGFGIKNFFSAKIRNIKQERQRIKMKKLFKILLKIFKAVLIIIAVMVTLVVVLDALWIYVPQWKASSKIEAVADYAKPVSEINVRDEARIIAIGEASHGNADFQTLKLEVLKQMVEKKGARCFALEADFSDGIVINNYIHGLSYDTAEEAIGGLVFNIYQTEEVLEMIEWMRAYNDRVEPDEQLSFYGFDMQNTYNGTILLADFCKANEIAASDDIVADIESINKQLVERSEELKDVANYDLMVRETEIIKQNIVHFDNYNPDDYIGSNNSRDSYMAENVAWISDYEKSLGHDVIVIAGHNGHVQKKAQFYDSMGSHLAEKYGKEYFVISTDYYHTKCNINIAGPDNSRGEYHFCSADPLAKQAKYFEGSYYLNFDEVEEGSEVAEIISSPMTMGSLGEGYSFMMKIVPTTNRVKFIPEELGDAMIFVYDAKPFTLLSK